MFKIKNANFKDIIFYEDIQIPENTMTFLCGESGCGKSTLLKLLNLTENLKLGEILYNDINITTMDTIKLRQEVLLFPQDIFLFDKTIEENFHEFYSYRNLKPLEEEKICEFLRICLADFPLDSSCTSLSGGERQRVLLAIFLSFSPKVLLLDEPTSALDHKNAVLLLTNLKNHCKCNGIKTIIISHDKSLMDEFADEVIAIKGRI